MDLVINEVMEIDNNNKKFTEILNLCDVGETWNFIRSFPGVWPIK